MAGHSKWANVQLRKGAQDTKRDKVFNKLIREISVAARVGGTDLGSNGRLRLAVDKARDAGMPRESIERAVQGPESDRGSPISPSVTRATAPAASP